MKLCWSAVFAPAGTAYCQIHMRYLETLRRTRDLCVQRLGISYRDHKQCRSRVQNCCSGTQPEVLSVSSHSRHVCLPKPGFADVVEYYGSLLVKLARIETSVWLIQIRASFKGLKYLPECNLSVGSIVSKPRQLERRDSLLNKTSSRQRLRRRGGPFSGKNLSPLWSERGPSCTENDIRRERGPSNHQRGSHRLRMSRIRAGRSQRRDFVASARRCLSYPEL